MPVWGFMALNSRKGKTRGFSKFTEKLWVCLFSFALRFALEEEMQMGCSDWGSQGAGERNEKGQPYFYLLLNCSCQQGEL